MLLFPSDASMAGYRLKFTFNNNNSEIYSSEEEQLSIETTRI
jgi:hypothetical protein